MSNWAQLTTGERIKHLRGKELTQSQLAEAAEVSLSLVQKAEQDRGELSLGSLLKLAAALKTDVGVILGQQAPRRGMSHDTRAALRQLSDAVHDSALGEWEGLTDPSSLDELSRARDLAWAAYWRGDTTAFAGLAAQVLVEGRARYAGAQGYEKQQLGLLLATMYQYASSTAILLGQRELALGALTSSRTLALQAGDPYVSVLVDSTLSWIHLRNARVAKAVSVAERAAARIEPSFSKPNQPQLIAFGRLMISAAVAAARGGNAASANDYLSQAHAAAARLGKDADLYGTYFGPSFAAAEAVGIAVSLGEYGRALKLAQRTELPPSVPKLARNRYKLDVALAQVENRLYDQAANTLIEVALDAPEWVRHQALPGVIGKRLAKVATAQVRRISDVIGVQLIA